MSQKLFKECSAWVFNTAPYRRVSLLMAQMLFSISDPLTSSVNKSQGTGTLNVSWPLVDSFQKARTLRSDLKWIHAQELVDSVLKIRVGESIEKNVVYLFALVLNLDVAYVLRCKAPFMSGCCSVTNHCPPESKSKLFLIVLGVPVSTHYNKWLRFP